VTSTQSPLGATAAGADGSSAHGSGRASIGELVSTLSEKLSLLVRDEIRLAKVEVAEKAKHAAVGIGMFAVAAFVGLIALGVLVTAVILGIIQAGLQPWAAALIVAVGLLIIAAVLAAIGKSALAKGSPATPVKAQASIKADVAALKEGLSS
jgi:uncharacterized membrane protein YqjE